MKWGIAVLLAPILTACASKAPVVQIPPAQPLPPLPPAEASVDPEPKEEQAKIQTFDFEGLDMDAVTPALRVPQTGAQRSCPPGTTAVAGSCLTPAPKTAVANGCVLMINSIPQTHVLVDGVYVGQTPQIGLQRAAGAHMVTFITDDATMKKAVSATCAVGERKSVVVKMN